MHVRVVAARSLTHWRTHNNTLGFAAVAVGHRSCRDPMPLMHMRESGSVCTAPPHANAPAYVGVPRLCVGRWLMFDEASHVALDTALNGEITTARLKGLPNGPLPMAPAAQRHLYATNPSFVDGNSDDGVLVKLTPFSFCQINSTARSSSFSRSATFTHRLSDLRVRQFLWLGAARRPPPERGTDGTVLDGHGALVRARVTWAEDAKPFRLGAARLLYATFTRKSASFAKSMWIVRLDSAPVPLALNYSGMGADEANWVPIPTAREAALLSYSLCPHVVLSCRPETGHCHKAYETKLDGCSDKLRGGSPMIRVRGVLLGVAHFKKPMRHFPLFYYTHVFYAAQPDPPYALLNVSAEFRLDDTWHGSISGVQYAAGLLVEQRSGRDHLLISYGEADCASFAASVPLDDVWHELGLNDRAGAATSPEAPHDAAARRAHALLTVELASPPSRAAPPLLRYAIVVKGPLLAVTRLVLSYYLETIGPNLSSTTGVVYSHNTGACLSAEVRAHLADLEARHVNFAAALEPPPPRSGLGYRNVQREACFRGAALALARWRVDYILVHRPDAAFQHPLALPGLAALHDAQPPPQDAPLRPEGRVGVCPFQVQLTDFYGRFHLDDHCIFGRSTAVLRYWSLNNPSYNASLPYYVPHPSPTHHSVRSACRVPGPESENGQLWVAQDEVERGAPPPRDTRTLIVERMWVIDPEPWDYACTRDRPPDRPALPLDPRRYGFRWPPNAARTPFGVLNLCPRSDGQYHCANALDVRNRTDAPNWGCKSNVDPDRGPARCPDSGGS